VQTGDFMIIYWLCCFL